MSTCCCSVIPPCLLRIEVLDRARSELWGNKLTTHSDKTPQGAFRDPLLRVLLRHRLGVPRIQALKELERAMTSELSTFDKSNIKSGTLRWQKSAEWEVNKMRTEGLMEPASKSGLGLWKLTLAGQKAAQEKK
jgi:hypothetical protein